MDKRKKVKMLVVGALLVSLALTATFYGFGATIKGEEKIENKTKVEIETEVLGNSDVEKLDYEVLDSIMCFAKVYENLDDLYNESEIIIEGTVLINEYVRYKDLDFTISTVKIDKSLKGESLKDTTIKVVQNGGVGSAIHEGLPEKAFEDQEEIARMREENKDKKQEIVYENAPVLKGNQKCILYLGKYEGPLGENLYVGTGDLQGRFKIDENGKVEAQSSFLTDVPKTATELEKVIAKKN